MFGSDAGHLFAKQVFHVDKIPSGFMIIEEGQSENQVIAKDGSFLGQLPFSIKLNDFRIEYYQTEEESVPQLNISTADGKNLQMAARAGEEISLNSPKGKLRVLRIFVNFKINKIDEQMVASDEPGTGQNPAAEVEFESSDGQKSQGYIFQRFSGFQQPASGLHITYAPQMPRMPKDFFSDLVVIRDGNVIIQKTIEVNHPLHFEGFHFYQHGYDDIAGKYTILSVTSDSGLYAVFGGYWLLCIGIIWRLWLTPAIKYLKNKKANKVLSNGN
jgi:cytochrome c biogenesis protein ResB